MRATWETLPKHESDHNALGKYSHQNNIILSGNADCFRWYLSVLADIDVYMECQDIESYHRSGKADRQKFKKIIVQLVNRKNCIKVLSHKKSLVKLIAETTILATVQKYLPVRILQPWMRRLPITTDKLKRNRHIQSCFSRDGIVKIKCEERAAGSVKIFQMGQLHQVFPSFDFCDVDEGDNIFLDACQVANDSIQFMYYCNFICFYFWHCAQYHLKYLRIPSFLKIGDFFEYK